MATKGPNSWRPTTPSQFRLLGRTLGLALGELKEWEVIAVAIWKLAQKTGTLETLQPSYVEELRALVPEAHR